MYEHYVNLKDLVPNEFGLGWDPSKDPQDAGGNATVYRFNSEPGGTPSFPSGGELKQRAAEFRSEDMAAAQAAAYGGGIYIPKHLREEAFTKYHDVNDYLRAERSVHKDCSPDGK